LGALALIQLFSSDFSNKNFVMQSANFLPLFQILYQNYKTFPKYKMGNFGKMVYWKDTRIRIYEDAEDKQKIKICSIIYHYYFNFAKYFKSRECDGRRKKLFSFNLVLSPIGTDNNLITHRSKQDVHFTCLTVRLIV